MLKVSIVTINVYQMEGRLPYDQLGRSVNFKRKDILKTLKIQINIPACPICICTSFQWFN